MRIGLDYLPASTHAPGLGRYARELSAALLRLPGPPSLALLELGRSGPRLPEAWLRLPQGAPVRRRRLALPRGLVSALARLGLGAERLAGGCDLFHQVRPLAPLPLGPRQPWTTCVSELPEGDLAILGPALAGAAAVLVFSDHTARRLRREAGLAPDRVRRVRVGSDHWSRVAGPREPPARPRLVALGAPLPGRRHDLLLEAAASLRAGGLDLELLLVGRGLEPLTALPAARALGDRLLLEDPDEARLPEQLAGATTLVHLAGEEQTAVTLLEACAAGLTVVASHRPAFRETVGVLARWLPDEALDEGPAPLADQLAAALEEAGDTALREQRLALAGRHRWADCAEDTLAVWCDLLER